jgi:hypothetical protein
MKLPLEAAIELCLHESARGWTGEGHHDRPGSGARGRDARSLTPPQPPASGAPRLPPTLARKRARDLEAAADLCSTAKELRRDGRCKGSASRWQSRRRRRDFAHRARRRNVGSTRLRTLRCGAPSSSCPRLLLGLISAPSRSGAVPDAPQRRCFAGRAGKMHSLSTLPSSLLRSSGREREAACVLRFVPCKLTAPCA